MACYQVTHVTPSDPPYILQSDADTRPNYEPYTQGNWGYNMFYHLPLGKSIITCMYIICCFTWLDIYIMFKCSQLKLPKISWDIIFPWLYWGCGQDHGQVWEIQLGIFASWIEDEWNHEMQCDAHYCHYFRYSSIAKAIAKYFEKVPQLNVKHNLQQWIHCQAHTSRLGQR